MVASNSYRSGKEISADLVDSLIASDRNYSFRTSLERLAPTQAQSADYKSSAT